MKKSNVFVALFLGLSLVLTSGFAASKSETLAAPKKKVHGSNTVIASIVVKSITIKKLKEFSAISEGTKSIIKKDRESSQQLAARTKQTKNHEVLAARTKQTKRSEA